MVRARSVMVAGVAFALPISSAAAAVDAELQGPFAMSGHVTTAVNVRGEYRGQSVKRTWTFTELCGAPPCQQVRLVRGRAGGSDTLVLNRQAAGSYSGAGRFYAPLRCGTRLFPHGEAVPFKLTVQITAATQQASGALIATAIDATYVNPARTNLTPCVALPSHDAAAYDGAAAPPATTPPPPTTSVASVSGRLPAGS